MAYYNGPDNSKAFSEFKADDSAHLKLLYCIDMLNEGVHVDAIIYMQQTGRGLSAGGSGSPVIFDLVDNFESLYSIDVLRAEIDEAFSLYCRTAFHQHGTTTMKQQVHIIGSMAICLSIRIM